MLTQQTLLQLQKYNFDLLARQVPSGRRRLRYIGISPVLLSNAWSLAW